MLGSLLLYCREELFSLLLKTMGMVMRKIEDIHHCNNAKRRDKFFILVSLPVFLEYVRENLEDQRISDISKKYFVDDGFF